MGTTLERGPADRQPRALPEQTHDVLERPDVAGATTSEQLRAPVRRRLAAGVVDTLLLLGVLMLVLGFELSTESLANWALTAWALLFVPLYFGLYHAFDAGGTPGQLELRVGVRRAGSEDRPSFVRALWRAYLGLAFAVLVLPVLVDVILLTATGRSLRDRLTGTTVVRVALAGSAPELSAPTTPELLELFEPEGLERSYLRRGWSLVCRRPRLLIGSVASVYVVLVSLVVALAFLLVADAPDDALTLMFWFVLALAILGSGVYWTQAAMVVAVEEVRVGRPASVARTLRHAATRANALSASLALILGFAYLGIVFVLPLVLLGRLTLVAPALVLEDRRVLGAFGRSCRLTSGRTWRSFGFVLLSLALLCALPAAALLAAGLLLGVGEGSSWAALVPVAGAAVAFVVGLTWVGAAWSLLYEDARRLHPPRLEEPCSR